MTHDEIKEFSAQADKLAMSRFTGKVCICGPHGSCNCEKRNVGQQRAAEQADAFQFQRQGSINDSLAGIMRTGSNQQFDVDMPRYQVGRNLPPVAQDPGGVQATADAFFRNIHEPQDGATAGTILDKARTAVTTDRSVTHGPKERSFEAIAGLWNSYLQARPKPIIEYPDGLPRLFSRDVALMMVLLKIGRSIQGTPVEDHFVDMAGYAAVAGELA